MNTIERARDRQIDVELHELYGSAAAPDLRDAILQRLDAAATGAPERAPLGARMARRAWLTAALMLIAGAIVAVIGLLPETDADLAPAAGDPEPVYIDTPDQLDTVPVGTRVLVITKMTVEALPRLARLRDLQVLNMGFEGSTLDATAARHIAELKKLEMLEFGHTATIRAGAFAALSVLPVLRDIALRGNEVEKAAYAELSELPALTTLMLPNHGVDADVMYAVARTNLQQLTLRDNPTITPAALRAICELRDTLETLDLSGTSQLDDDVLDEILSQCSRLRQLGVAETPALTVALIDNLIRHGSDLAGLSIHGNRIAESDLLRLVRALPKLETLSIGGSRKIPGQISDEVLAAVGALEQLRQVGLRYSMLVVTPEGLDHLTPLKLEFADFEGMIVVPDSEILARAHKWPDCRIRLPSGRFLELAVPGEAGRRVVR